jgi:hypothetical protein
VLSDAAAEVLLRECKFAGVVFVRRAPCGVDGLCFLVCAFSGMPEKTSFDSLMCVDNQLRCVLFSMHIFRIQWMQ